MKRLFLLRHAQAMPMDAGKDKERALTPKGLEDARLLGALMERTNLKPELILSSDARRTKETAAALNEKLSAPLPVEFSSKLYDASRGTLFEMIQSADDALTSLMLLAHNPTIYELCVLLANEGAPALLGRLDQGYVPATLSVFELSIAKWEDLDPDQGKLVEYLSPSDYNTPSPARWN
jgi:phosphohistidine phosphatase